MIALLLAAALTAQAPKPATNLKCPVLSGPVTATSMKTVVRGQEYRVCCAGCPGELAANPDKYLNKDGTPKNAK
jgi:YHS domain-containing protein